MISETEYKFIQMNADMLTPIAVFNRINGKKKFLLESSLKHDGNGRYSFIGMNPYMEFIGEGDQVSISKPNKSVTTERGKPLDLLKNHIPKLDQFPLDFPFFGGGIGFIGYDAIRQYETIGPDLEDEQKIPDVHFMFYQDVIIFDHKTQMLFIVSLNLDEKRTEKDLIEKIAEIKESLFTKEEPQLFDLSKVPIHFKPLMEKEDFLEKVQIAQEFIRKGDIFQIVLSQKMKGRMDSDPFQFYRKLRNANPSPYMFYIDFDEYVLLGASPESLIKTIGSQVITNPIAGTRPRGNTQLEDSYYEKELLEDEKELAEHRMLVDLSRNDIGRVCEPGSITIPKYMVIEKYQHVMHIVSEVKGMMKPEFTGIDALKVCLPAGTVSGAPKIRAMQIINELEKQKRGVYAGAIGYINVNGNMDFALAIRTLVIKDGVAYLQAGAGIVHDSIPENEYIETLNKAKSLLEVNKDDHLARQL
ncbi:anthranilate synthase component I [Heyndrickxia sporothermodurans]|uniref:anthranilate synthase component I n=1 Tax=Heyndrickxia TaxID=2837504 RepID=UPI000D39F334|nr:anthranilate synthase component I [Heyndrickxia sporothermodurans]MED3653001.1 anthranilate synthase component I [Heyndrickxia sporothermodurans]PTY79135.1 anthranilate synthase component I [Heyndrickxia sporothermodurans]